MSRKEHIWVIDDDHAIRWVLEKALQRDGMTVTSFDSAIGRSMPSGKVRRRMPSSPTSACQA